MVWGLASRADLSGKIVARVVVDQQGERWICTHLEERVRIAFGKFTLALVA